MVSFDERRSRCQCPIAHENALSVSPGKCEPLIRSLTTPSRGRRCTLTFGISIYPCEDEPLDPPELKGASCTIITSHGTTFAILAPSEKDAKVGLNVQRSSFKKIEKEL